METLELFYDGGCMLCSREIAFLRRRQTADMQLKFTDIAACGFEPEAVGRTMDELMGAMHARMGSGEWMTGVDVFREIYGRLGFGRLVRLSRLPGISWALGVGYRCFARLRLLISGGAECQACAVR